MTLPKRHPWPTRRNAAGRYEVLINGAWVSRSRAWQVVQHLEGRCRCGRARGAHSNLCPRCHERHKLRNRAAAGCQAWKPGGVGRPPRA